VKPAKRIQRKRVKPKPKVDPFAEREVVVTAVPRVNRNILLFDGGRVRVRKDHKFKRDSVIRVKWSGERDVYELKGVYDRWGRLR